MKIWARVGVTLDVNETVFESDPRMAILFALYTGKSTMDGETYIPGIHGVPHAAFDDEVSFNFDNIPIKA